MNPQLEGGHQNKQNGYILGPDNRHYIREGEFYTDQDYALSPDQIKSGFTD